jgi:hypothetical protein
MALKRCASALLPLLVVGMHADLARAEGAVVASPPPASTPVESRSVAATSSLDADHRTFVPIAGPWMALSDRGPCGGTAGRSCDAEDTDKVLIVADGIGQALGGLLIIGAFLNPETRTVTRSTTAAEQPSVRLAPAAMGSGGYGLQAVGSF